MCCSASIPIILYACGADNHGCGAWALNIQQSGLVMLVSVTGVYYSLADYIKQIVLPGKCGGDGQCVVNDCAAMGLRCNEAGDILQ